MSIRVQQENIYTAEDRTPIGIVFDDHTAAQAYVDNITQTQWWHEYHPRCREVVIAKAPANGFKPSGCARFYEEDQYGGIVLARSGLNERTVLHELGHIAAAERFGSDCHDPAFAREFLELTFRLRGTEEWLRLRDAFAREGVVWDTGDPE